MNRPTYEHDAYSTELATEVIEVGNDGNRPYAITADTIFYPEGGGQPADRGTMGGIDVVDVRKVGREIRHYLDGELEPGPVRQVLDWGRRFDHMQQHTGQHLLTATALGQFGWATTAFHMGPAVCDIELDVASLSDEAIRRLEDAVAEEIRSACPVTIQYATVDQMDALGVRSRLLPDGFEGQLRLVEIDGLDLNTCGGTHVRSTAEIGVLSLIGTEPMRGGTRISFIAGGRVRRRLIEHEKRNLELRTLLDAADDELPELVALRLGREKVLARENRRLLIELAQAEAEKLIAGDDEIIAAHWDGREMPFIQEIGKKLVDLAPERVALLTVGSGGEGAFLVVASDGSGLDLGAVGPEICSILEGRGGGRAPFFQGKSADVGRRGEAVELLVDEISS